MNGQGLNRREVLGGAAIALTGGWLRTAGASGSDPVPRRPAPGASVTIALEEPIATIRPALYGQFTEHIGGVIYDGVWVGPNSKVPNINGIRKALVEHVRALGPIMIRWPGGCFADKYHWRDGIGPRDKRPRRFGRWREDIESNQFGTHEFLEFCRLCGATPYLAANVGMGTAEEFQSWVEYCNAPAGSTSLADERVANGDRDPFRVRYWGVGNESWGCGGKFTPEDYCREYRKFTEWVPSFGTDLYLIAAGPNGNDVEWTRRFFDRWADYARAPIHGWAPHYYCGTTGHALKFTQDQWYEMLFKANKMEALIVDQWAALAKHDPKHAIKLVIDEWGAWHPAGTEINPRHLFEQMGCLRDALVAALTLDTFNRHAEKIDIGCVAQLVSNIHSLFLADGDKFVATPNYHVFAMYRPHQNGKSVRMVTEAEDVSFRAGGKNGSIVRVAGSASVRDRVVTLTLVHTHATEPIEVEVKLKGGSASEVRRTVLTHTTLNAHNTFEAPNTVVPSSADEPGLKGDVLRVTLPPASVSRFDVRLG
ncbi:MAG: alpha-L-arabinofuranosidase C-terminal domain-containing protein [Isosphaeraceae bacterium]